MTSPDEGASDGLRWVTFAEALAQSRSLGRLGTGSGALDRILDGGFGEARITEVFGASNSGKTQLAMQATVMAAAKGWSSVYVDTEATFRPERVAQMAESRGLDAKAVLKMVFSLRAKDVESQTHVLDRMRDDERVSSAKLLVVDTVTKNFTLEFPGRERTGRRQGALGAYLNRVARDAYFNRRFVLLTNRVASITRDGTSQDVDVGGITLRRFVDASLRLRRDGGYVLAQRDDVDPQTTATCRLSERGIE